MADLLRLGLEARGHRVWVAATAAEAMAGADEARPDLIICDLMLPDGNGLVLCDDLRQRCGAPVIVCSGTKRKEDRILALKLGADDFIAKPFDIAEVQARVEAALRRADRRAVADGGGALRPAPLLRLGALVVDHARCAVTVGGAALALTPTEYRLLAALAERPDELCRRGELAERVWGHHDRSMDASLEVHVRRLRGKLRSAGAAAPDLVTVRGFGFKLVAGREPAPIPAAS